MIQRMLAIWSLVPHPFLNPACTFGSSQFTYCWSLVKWGQLYGSLNILWHCLSLGLEWKLTFSSPVATAEFSKFAGILSAALYSILFWNFNSSVGIPSPALALIIASFLRPTWLHTPGCLALGEWPHHHDYLGHEDFFLYSSSVFLSPLVSVFCFF